MLNDVPAWLFVTGSTLAAMVYRVRIEDTLNNHLGPRLHRHASTTPVMFFAVLQEGRWPPGPPWLVPPVERMTWGVVSPGPRGAVGDADEWSDYRPAEIASPSRRSTQLVVSELVTNARKYAPGPCLLLTLEVEEGAVQVSVWDSSTTLPSVLAADPERIGQHGLEIVMAVCQSFEIHREPVGKRVVATITLGNDPIGDMAGHQMLS